MIFRCFLAVAAFGIFVSSSAISALAAPVTLAELLEVGWDTKPQSRADADRIYRQFVEQSPGDNQIVYAYALVKMQQRDYPEATRLLDQYLAIAKTDLAAWRA
ncbi:MAG TPA: hypothetical protein VL096_12175, partial [Pirellulaceae bacterium]|nr:hypothetical protein [Pirellulaceae bacterium]